MHKLIFLATMMAIPACFLPTAVTAAPAGALDDGPPSPRARVPLLSDEEAWKRLPAVESGGGQPLPSWARALAGSLPRTTAAMLDLDRIQRTRSPLGPLLRGKMRWVAARANHCEYSMAQAEADLKRAGLDEAGLRRLKGDHKDFPEPEQAALEFAHRMTVDAAEVTDAEVAGLIARYGEAKVVAMVLLLAYANFQDRLLLALDVPIEAGGPLPPLEVRFNPKAEPPAVPTRQRPEGRPVPEEPERIDDPFWLSMEPGDLQGRLTEQRSRPGRIRVPSWEEVLRVMPPEYPQARETGSHPMEPGDHGLPARAGGGLVGLHPHLSARKRSRIGSSRRACSGS